MILFCLKTPQWFPNSQIVKVKFPRIVPKVSCNQISLLPFLSELLFHPCPSQNHPPLVWAGLPSEAIFLFPTLPTPLYLSLGSTIWPSKAQYTIHTVCVLTFYLVYVNMKNKSGFLFHLAKNSVKKTKL